MRALIAEGPSGRLRALADVHEDVASARSTTRSENGRATKCYSAMRAEDAPAHSEPPFVAGNTDRTATGTDHRFAPQPLTATGIQAPQVERHPSRHIDAIITLIDSMIPEGKSNENDSRSARRHLAERVGASGRGAVSLVGGVLTADSVTRRVIARTAERYWLLRLEEASFTSPSAPPPIAGRSSGAERGIAPHLTWHDEDTPPISEKDGRVA